MGLIFLALFFFGLAAVFYFEKPPKKPPISEEIRAPLKRGFVIAQLSYQENDDLEVRASMNRWAIRLENPELPLDDALQAILPQTKVISVALDLPKPALVEPSKPTPTERVVHEMKTAEELLVAYCKAKESIDPVLDQHSVGTVGSRSIKTCLEDIVDQQIIRIVNPSGVTSPFRT